MRALATLEEDGSNIPTIEVPEKGLLAAVLERSYRDLYCDNFEDFRSAMYWFMEESPTPDDFKWKIYFDQVVEILGLSISRVEFLKAIVEEFSPYLESKAQFKLDRPKVIKIRQQKIWRRGHRVTL